MKEALAERLLAQVMRWSQQEVAAERPILQTLATYKFDEYQQFSTGMHFVESLAIWLSNFDLLEERNAAYRFVKERLIFISEDEMRHLVSLAYYDHVRPTILRKAAAELGVPEYLVSQVASSTVFAVTERQSLFLGLSDGARIDVLRRMSLLDNEQVHAIYQVSDEKAADMLRELQQDIPQKRENEIGFATLFLLDDFAGSGDSLLRKENGHFKGKIARCLEALGTTKLVDLGSVDVYIILYLATKQAIDTLTDRIVQFSAQGLPHCKITAVHALDSNVRVTPERDPIFNPLLQKYYDANIMDKHLSKGGHDVIHGYANCSLPLVLGHNTPNNSVYLLWASKPGIRTKALFPRVSRHREDA